MPVGPTIGYSWRTYDYSTSATDPDGDSIMYILDWGDGTTSETGFLESGKSASASNSWRDQGTYYVKVRAEDSDKASSSWSGPIAVRIS